MCLKYEEFLHFVLFLLRSHSASKRRHFRQKIVALFPGEMLILLRQLQELMFTHARKAWYVEKDINKYVLPSAFFSSLCVRDHIRSYSIFQSLHFLSIFLPLFSWLVKFNAANFKENYLQIFAWLFAAFLLDNRNCNLDLFSYFFCGIAGKLLFWEIQEFYTKKVVYLVI